MKIVKSFIDPDYACPDDFETLEWGLGEDGKLYCRDGEDCSWINYFGLMDMPQLTVKNMIRIAKEFESALSLLVFV